MVSAILITALVSYFLGSIPAGYLAGRLAGVDIRKEGSGNIGATNVLRVLGKKYGYAVFAVDLLKGIVSVRLALWLAERANFQEAYAPLLGIFAALMCVLGNTLPVWLNFRGGKGVATSAGALLGLIPLAGVISLAIWLVVFLMSRYVSLASIVAVLLLPLTVGVLQSLQLISGSALLYFSVVVLVVVVWRHRSNVRRLMNGTEERFKRR